METKSEFNIDNIEITNNIFTEEFSLKKQKNSHLITKNLLNENSNNIFDSSSERNTPSEHCNDEHIKPITNTRLLQLYK